MEVHSHVHTPRKKFSQYAFEFFMLFLAVFCGSVAEYQLEKFVEHHKEKQYIVSLITDLQQDSITLGEFIHNDSLLQRHYDSLTMIIRKGDYSNTCNAMYAQYIPTDYFWLFKGMDRTIQQLKNAGQMRLISDLAASDSITDYYETLRFTVEQGDAFTRYFDEYHRDAFNVFEYAQFDSIRDMPEAALTKPKMTLLTTDPVVLKKLDSKAAVMSHILDSYIEDLRVLHEQGISCMQFLRKKYHLRSTGINVNKLRSTTLY